VLCRDLVRDEKAGAEGQSLVAPGSLVTGHNERGHGRWNQPNDEGSSSISGHPILSI